VKVLLDTCILAELRHPRGHRGVEAAVEEIADADLFLSVLTVGEIAKGISLLPSSKKKRSLASWLNGLEARFADRILGVDLETARLWGALTARAQPKGLVIPAVDGLLAATALRHGLHVMTRNTPHFEASGALVIDPWLDESGSQ
jgi:predicted nucleic acid-binding protein